MAFGAPFICPGRIVPGMSLVDLLYQVYEILTYQKLTTHDALNREAAAWARANQGRFPTDRRPLKRRPARAGNGAHMSMLDKHLARYAQESRQLGADRWQLALTNGAALAVTALRDEGFVLLDADSGVSPATERLELLARHAQRLPAAVKFALTCGSDTGGYARSSRCRRSRTPPGERVREHLDGMRTAAHRLHQWAFCEAAGEAAASPTPSDDGQSIAGSLMETLKEAGWNYHERPGGALLADLETGSQFLQAEVGGYGAGRVSG